MIFETTTSTDISTSDTLKLYDGFNRTHYDQKDVIDNQINCYLLLKQRVNSMAESMGYPDIQKNTIEKVITKIASFSPNTNEFGVTITNDSEVIIQRYLENGFFNLITDDEGGLIFSFIGNKENGYDYKYYRNELINEELINSVTKSFMSAKMS